MDLKNFTAQDARNMSDSLDNTKHSVEINKILECIHNKAKAGEKSYFCYTLSKPVELELEKRGFTVNFMIGDHNDPRDSDYYTITW